MPAQQQQNITIPAPGSMGLNTEQAPTAQDGSFALKADNAIIDQFGRVGSRKAFAELTNVYNLSYSQAVGTVSTKKEVITMGTGSIGDAQYVLVLVRVDQYNIANTVIQSDWSLCTLDQSGTNWELNEITTPSFAVPTALDKAKIVAFNDAFYLFSDGNECVVWDGTTHRSSSRAGPTQTK